VRCWPRHNQGPIRAAAAGTEYELEVDPEAIIEELPVGLQQRVEILKALYRGAEILILDEPTGVLTPAEADHLFRILKQLKNEGKTILLITHKLREIMAATDDGLGHAPRRDGGHPRPPPRPRWRSWPSSWSGAACFCGSTRNPAAKGPLLSVENLTVRDSRGVEVVKDVSFDVREGEIVGIAGVPATASPNCSTLSGIRRATRQGDLKINGRPIDLANRHRRRRRVAPRGLAHVPEDRHHMGLVIKVRRVARTPFSAITGPEIFKRPVARPAAIRKMRSTNREIRYPPAKSRCSRPPISPAATSRKLCWLGKSNGTRGPFGRSADPRRGCRRHRIHSQAAHRTA
jgi:ABC-type uncharacterized transport system ATPase subunit